MKLADRIALVTGSDSGIGRQIATAFAREGADVLVHFNRDVEGARETAERVRAHGRRAEILQGEFFARALALMQSFDIVVNNAGIGSSERHSLDTELDGFIRIINVEQHRRHLSLRKRP